MPRRLPWLNNSGSGRSQTKQKTKPVARNKIPSDIDDSFFDDTVLASPKKGKERILDSGDDLPDIIEDSSSSRIKKRNEWGDHKGRAQSSSPPPIQDLVQPQIEFMRKGTKYDLRDDEWMMVEDEFLMTAQLFTRHLHIAEYEKLKEQIEAKKEVQVEEARVVVKEASMSVEGKMKEKAKVQEKKQRKAILDVFASQHDEDEAEEDAAAITRSTSYLPKPLAACDSDSNDLDFPRQQSKHSLQRTTTNTPIPPRHSTKAPTSPVLGSKSNPAPPTQLSSFAKPALPPRTSKPRTVASRKSRATPFDMLDDYTPPPNRTNSSTNTNQHTSRQSSMRSPMPTKSTVTSTDRIKDRSVTIDDDDDDDDDDWAQSKRGSSGASKSVADRLAKRKAEREKEEGQKSKTVKLDDIPTFLF